MPDRTEAPPQALPRQLLRELHGFLSLEAPFLIRDLPQVSEEGELEAALLAKIEERFRTGEEYARERLYPLVNHQRAVNWAREALEIQVRGFFERRRIVASITPRERKLMLRTMMLTRAVDRHLKKAFDSREIAWEGHPSPQKGFRSLRSRRRSLAPRCRLRRPRRSYGRGRFGYTGDYIGAADPRSRALC